MYGIARRPARAQVAGPGCSWSVDSVFLYSPGLSHWAAHVTLYSPAPSLPSPVPLHSCTPRESPTRQSWRRRPDSRCTPLGSWVELEYSPEVAGVTCHVMKRFFFFFLSFFLQAFILIFIPINEELCFLSLAFKTILILNNAFFMWCILYPSYNSEPLLRKGPSWIGTGECLPCEAYLPWNPVSGRWGGGWSRGRRGIRRLIPPIRLVDLGEKSRRMEIK